MYINSLHLNNYNDAYIFYKILYNNTYSYIFIYIYISYNYLLI